MMVTAASIAMRSISRVTDWRSMATTSLVVPSVMPTSASVSFVLELSPIEPLSLLSGLSTASTVQPLGGTSGGSARLGGMSAVRTEAG